MRSFKNSKIVFQEVLISAFIECDGVRVAVNYQRKWWKIYDMALPASCLPRPTSQSLKCSSKSVWSANIYRNENRKEMADLAFGNSALIDFWKRVISYHLAVVELAASSQISHPLLTIPPFRSCELSRRFWTRLWLASLSIFFPVKTELKNGGYGKNTDIRSYWCSF